MLYYLNHTISDCSFAVYQCAQYTFEHKASHEVAAKRIGQYLKGTWDKGLILDPSDDWTIDCYPDTDFARLWGFDHPQDPDYVCSRTGYVITFDYLQWNWSMYVAMSSAYKDLFPTMGLINEIRPVFDIPANNKSCFHVCIHEENVGALLLGQLEPRRMTPQTKH